MTVKELVKSNPQGIVAKAYAFAERAHKGQERKSGEPYLRSALREKQKKLKSRQTPSKTELRVSGENRLGLLKDISGVISRSHLNILSVHSPNQPGNRFSVVKIECETTDKEKIVKLVFKLKNLKGIKEVSYRIL